MGAGSWRRSPRASANEWWITARQNISKQKAAAAAVSTARFLRVWVSVIRSQPALGAAACSSEDDAAMAGGFCTLVGFGDRGSTGYRVIPG